MKKPGWLLNCLILLLSACGSPFVQTDVTVDLDTTLSALPALTPLETRIPPTITSTSTCAPSTSTPTVLLRSAGKPLADEKKVLFIFGDGFDYRHYEGTRKALEKEEYHIQVASNTLMPIEGNIAVHGFEIISRPWQTAPPVKADLLLQDVQISEFMGIVFISDRGILSDPPPEVEHIVQNAAQLGLVLAAQEFGIYLIANAGLLEGKEVTANPLICREMEVNYNAICTLMPVQRDEGIVTADPTMSTVSFARAIMGEIEAHNP